MAVSEDSDCELVGVAWHGTEAGAAAAYPAYPAYQEDEAVEEEEGEDEGFVDRLPDLPLAGFDPAVFNALRMAEGLEPVGPFGADAVEVKEEPADEVSEEYEFESVVDTQGEEEEREDREESEEERSGQSGVDESSDEWLDWTRADVEIAGRLPRSEDDDQ